MTVADKLLQLNQVKQDIKEAIEMRGIPMTNVAFTEYANKILDISGELGEYFNYALDYYTATGNSSQFSNAWRHSLTVETVNRANYPNGETEGVIIPEGVTSIGNNAFFGWYSNNKPLLIPDSVTSIGDFAFQNWASNNQPLVIPDSVTSIGNSTFFGWSSNTHPLIIPSSVTSISINTFYGWESVSYVEIQAVIPPSLSSYTAFSGQNNAPIYVPDESVAAYKAATNWVNLAGRIFSISDK
jgi:hypothetical protein